MTSGEWYYPDSYSATPGWWPAQQARAQPRHCCRMLPGQRHTPHPRPYPAAARRNYRATAVSPVLILATAMPTVAQTAACLPGSARHPAPASLRARARHLRPIFPASACAVRAEALPPHSATPAYPPPACLQVLVSTACRFAPALLQSEKAEHQCHRRPGSKRRPFPHPVFHKDEASSPRALVLPCSRSSVP